jgi:hypothetical protein
MAANKTKRIMVRVTPQVKAHFEKVAGRLHTTVSDVFMTGACVVEVQAADPQGFRHLKAETISREAERALWA